MLRYDFENSVGHWICSTSHALERAMAAELRPLGITFRQMQVLASLALHGELSQSDLAARLHIEPPTLTGVLSRMERDGWIERTTCADDRRRKLVRPLPLAAPVWDRIVEAAHSVRARALLGVSPGDRERLRTLLDTIQTNLEPQLVQEPSS